jgi:hypothetical protein
MTQNINLRLIKWIGENEEYLSKKPHFRQLQKQIAKDLNLNKEQLSSNELYDLIYPTDIIHCNNAKFISFSVGYRTCKKGCDCYTTRLSSKIKQIKSEYTDEQRLSINRRRETTNIHKYGVVNQSFRPEVVDKIKQSHLNRTEVQKEETKLKTKQTVQQKYNVDHVMQVEEFKQKNHTNVDYTNSVAAVKLTKSQRYNNENYNNPKKRAETNLVKYGVQNQSHRPEVKDKISTKLRKKYYSSHQTKYNITPLFSPIEYVPGALNKWKCNSCNSIITGKVLNGQFTRCTKCFPYTKSLEEQEVKDYIESLGVDLIENDRTIIAPKELDIVIPSKNLAIEYCGNYRHLEKFGKTKFYHYNKTVNCANNGITLITLFSDQWAMKQDIVKSRIAFMLGQYTKKIYARNCIIQAVSNSVAAEFMNMHHLQGAVNCKISIGLYFNTELVACMQFSNSRFEKNKVELVRYAVKQRYAVVGAASKLWNYFLSLYDPTTVVTYSDNSWGLTNFYNKLGFTKISNGVPGYCYIHLSNVMKRYSRVAFQKHKLKEKLKSYDPILTEYQNMLNENYDRLWDCGHSVWHWNKSNT